MFGPWDSQNHQDQQISNLLDFYSRPRYSSVHLISTIHVDSFIQVRLMIRTVSILRRAVLRMRGGRVRQCFRNCLRRQFAVRAESGCWPCTWRKPDCDSKPSFWIQNEAFQPSHAPPPRTPPWTSALAPNWIRTSHKLTAFQNIAIKFAKMLRKCFRKI